jgi:hypothetical protein
MRRPAPHCDTSPGVPCSCGWRPPCPGGCPSGHLIQTADSLFCTLCGSDNLSGGSVSHPGASASCQITAQAQQPVVCSCGWRHPDWTRLEWEMVNEPPQA